MDSSVRVVVAPSRGSDGNTRLVYTSVQRECMACNVAENDRVIIQRFHMYVDPIDIREIFYNLKCVLGSVDIMSDWTSRVNAREGQRPCTLLMYSCTVHRDLVQSSRAI